MEERAALNGAFNVLGLRGGNTDPYEILGLHASATLAEVRAAYKRKTLKLHPNRHANADALMRSVMPARMLASTFLSAEATCRSKGLIRGAIAQGLSESKQASLESGFTS